MATAVHDTFIRQYSIPDGLFADQRPLVAYIRLSPQVPGGERWWAHVPVTDVDVPVLADAAGLARFEEPSGLTTLQSRVSAGYVAELAASLKGREAYPWPPLSIARVDAGLWLLDGNHRAAAAVLAGRARHPAQVVDVALLRSCPCGWSGAGGEWLRHHCAEAVLA